MGFLRLAFLIVTILTYLIMGQNLPDANDFENEIPKAVTLEITRAEPNAEPYVGSPEILDRINGPNPSRINLNPSHENSVEDEETIVIRWPVFKNPSALITSALSLSKQAAFKNLEYFSNFEPTTITSDTYELTIPIPTESTLEEKTFNIAPKKAEEKPGEINFMEGQRNEKNISPSFLQEEDGKMLGNISPPKYLNGEEKLSRNISPVISMANDEVPGNIPPSISMVDEKVPGKISTEIWEIPGSVSPTHLNGERTLSQEILPAVSTAAVDFVYEDMNPSIIAKGNEQNRSNISSQISKEEKIQSQKGSFVVAKEVENTVQTFPPSNFKINQNLGGNSAQIAPKRVEILQENRPTLVIPTTTRSPEEKPSPIVSDKTSDKISLSQTLGFDGKSLQKSTLSISKAEVDEIHGVKKIDPLTIEKSLATHFMIPIIENKSAFKQDSSQTTKPPEIISPKASLGEPVQNVKIVDHHSAVKATAVPKIVHRTAQKMNEWLMRRNLQNIARTTEPSVLMQIGDEEGNVEKIESPKPAVQMVVKPEENKGSVRTINFLPRGRPRIQGSTSQANPIRSSNANQINPLREMERIYSNVPAGTRKIPNPEIPNALAKGRRARITSLRRNTNNSNMRQKTDPNANENSQVGLLRKFSRSHLNAPHPIEVNMAGRSKQNATAHLTPRQSAVPLCPKGSFYYRQRQKCYPLTRRVKAFLARQRLAKQKISSQSNQPH